MTDAVQFKAVPTLDKSAVIFSAEKWRIHIPVAELPSWVRLYRSLRDRDHGRFARFYVQPTEALEACAKKWKSPFPICGQSRRR